MLYISLSIMVVLSMATTYASEKKESVTVTNNIQVIDRHGNPRPFNKRERVAYQRAERAEREQALERERARQNEEAEAGCCCWVRMKAEDPR